MEQGRIRRPGPEEASEKRKCLLMRNTCLYLAALVLSLLAGSSSAQGLETEIPAKYGYIVKLGQAVPDFELELPDGSKVDLKSLRGKVVMLNFTATWCGECRKRMPRIENEIWQKHKDDPGFSLYAIHVQDPKDKVLELKRQMGSTYPIALDPEAENFFRFSGRGARGAGVPRAVIIDRSGRIVFATGYYRDDEFDEIKRLISELLSDDANGK